MEKIDIKEFLDDIENELLEGDKYSDCSNPPKYYVSSMLNYSIDDFDSYSASGEKFKFIKSWCEKGDGYDEETHFGIYERISDGKHFQLHVHDAGFIGPETLTMSEYLIEIKK